MRKVTTHELKTDPAPFKAMWSGEKKADLRDLSDRDVSVGDVIVFQEYVREDDTASMLVPGYTGFCMIAIVTHIQHGYILPKNGAMLSVEVLNRIENGVPV